MVPIALIGCGKRKAAAACPASEMYTGSYFKAVASFVKKRFPAHYILSAKYGLLKPSQLIQPYDLTLNKFSRGGKEAWAARVHAQMLTAFPEDAALVFFCGQNYYQSLIPLLPFPSRTPFKGLGGMGKQLRWMKEQTR